MSRSTLIPWSLIKGTQLRQTLVTHLRQASCTMSDATIENAADQGVDPLNLTTQIPTLTAVMSRQPFMMTEQLRVGGPNMRGPTGTSGHPAGS